MRRKLFLALILVFLLSVSAFAAVGYNNSSNVTVGTATNIGCDPSLACTFDGSNVIFGGNTTPALTVVGTATTLDPTKGNYYTLSPTGNTTISTATAPAGQNIYLVITSAQVTARTVTFGTGFKTNVARNVVTTSTTIGKILTVEFIGDGTNFDEVSSSYFAASTTGGSVGM